jgi:hypothetical protein
MKGTRQVLFDNEPQKPGHALVWREAGTRQHPLELPPGGVRLGSLDRDYSEHALGFNNLQTY